jgi:hypothetical protein
MSLTNPLSRRVRDSHDTGNLFVNHDFLRGHQTIALWTDQEAGYALAKHWTMDFSDDRGSASMEFLVAAIGLLVPVVALTVTTSEIASATFAATVSARQGVRAFTLADSVQSGHTAIANITNLAITDHGLSDADWRIELDCAGRSCRQRGSLVSLAVSIDVPLRFIPALPGIDIAPSVTVSRSATARVSTTSVNR